MVNGETLFPCRLVLKNPDSKYLVEHVSEIVGWIRQLSEVDGSYYRVEWREVNHRIFGKSRFPHEVWVDSMENAVDLIGKRKDMEKFATLVAMTRTNQPGLLPWLAKKPFRALGVAKDWRLLLAIVAWLRQHPHPGIYLRQVDIPGVHTKLVEGHRGLLTELLDVVLPPEVIDMKHTGAAGFCRRYGFLDKPGRVRVRVLDPDMRLLPGKSDQDIAITQSAFSELDFPVSKVFITENEINFLAFPKIPGAMVIFGAGYGFENFRDVPWLKDKKIYYWGDIDTHGFAILNQLREFLPNAISLLMDIDTLMAHKLLWVKEETPNKSALGRLTAEERDLYDKLRQGSLGECVRLEQERIAFAFWSRALSRL